MITILLLQNGECHINSYRLTNGNYRTICSKTIDKNSYVNTLSADDTFPNTCLTCKLYYDELYRSDLDYKTSTARSMNVTNLKNTLEYNRDKIDGPEMDYYNIEKRDWWRLNKYKRLITRGKTKSSKNKYKFLK